MMRRWFLLLFLVSVFTALAVASPTATKTIRRVIIVAPGTGVVESRVYVTIDVESKGEVALEDATFAPSARSIVSYDANVRVETRGNFTHLLWEGIRVESEKVIGYSITAPPLLLANATLFVDGREVNVTCRGSYCVAKVGAESDVTYRITIKNNVVINGSKPPLTLIVTMPLKRKYLTVVEEKPSSNTRTEMGDVTVYMWIITVEDAASLEIKFRVKRLDPWYEVTLPSLEIIAPLNPEHALRVTASYEEEVRGYLEKSKEFEERAIALSSEFQSFSRVLNETVYNLTVFAELLREACNKSLTAAVSLETASRLAFEASRKMNRMAGRAAKTAETLREVNKATDAALEMLSKLEDILDRANDPLPYEGELLPGLPANLSSPEDVLAKTKAMARSLKKALKRLRSLSSSISEGEKDLREAANMLETLGAGLAEAALRMRELALVLNTAAEKVDVAVLDLGRWSEELESGQSEMMALSSEVRGLREGLEAKLSELRSKREALEVLMSVYSSQETLIRDVNGSTARVIPFSDEIVVRTLSVKLRKHGRKASITVPLHASGPRPTAEACPALAALGLISCAALLAKLNRRITRHEIVDELESIIRELEELEGSLKEAEYQEDRTFNSNA